MAVAITSSSNGHSTGAVASYTLSHTTDGNDLYALVGVYSLDANVVSCTFNGVSMARVGRLYINSGAVAELYIFFLPNVAAVTANIVATPAAGTRFFTVAGLNVSGCGGLRAINITQQNGTSTTVTVISKSGDMVLDFVTSDAANQNWTVGGGQTQVYEQVDASGDEKSALSYIVAASTSTTLTQSLSQSNNLTAFGFALGVEGSGGGGGEHSAVF